ncbi:MAG: SH3 domain-containing protein [Chloroflexi bacterium]|nr:MAG: SH3 domain-containing protein [Chloroflexota bacterium]
MRKIVVALAFAGAAGLACGGGGDKEQPSISSSASIAAITRGASASASPSQAPSQDPAEAALAAAIELIDGVSEADCTTNNPEQKECVSIDPNNRNAASLGIAVLGVEAPAGSGAALLMGREADGNWAYYAGGQQYYQASKLPGEMRVCTQGTGLNVRAEASADAQLVRTVEDNSTVTGEEFVLTQPGTPPPSFVAGYGWYRISAPVEGWVYSKFVSGLADCSLHDSLETP